MWMRVVYFPSAFMAFTRLPTPLWLSILTILSLSELGSYAYFADFSLLGGRPHEPTCVDIPKNMSLCSDVGYEKMRLPNLLDHDTLTEVQQQSGSWVPLLNVQCHPNTKLFLCSLFTPVCLESQIFPCRSLCVAVQQSCELRMKAYGYHWPDMLRCDKFPLDNDMCIKAHNQHITPETQNKDSGCNICHPVEAIENILHHFCKSDIVLRGRIKHQKGKRVSLRKLKIFKSEGMKKSWRRSVRVLLNDEEGCCKINPGKDKLLVMGAKTKDNFLTPSFVMPWKSKTIRKAVRLFRNLNCDDPNSFKLTDSSLVTSIDGNIKGEVKKKKNKDRSKGKNNKKKESRLEE